MGNLTTVYRVIFLAACLAVHPANASDRKTDDLLAGADAVQSGPSSPLSESVKALGLSAIELGKHRSTLDDGGLANNSTRLRGANDSKIFESAVPGVVLILTEDELGYYSGSGSLISSDGIILTNYHVIEDADSIIAVFYPKQGLSGSNRQILDASVLYPAEVVQVDQYADLALLKIGEVPQRAKVLTLAKDATVPAVGDDVHALGHPDGEFWTYTRGYISQVRTDYQWGTGRENAPNRQADVIQTQTPINPGNSGGPLLNEKGDIIGVNSFGNIDMEGLNFAVALSSINAFLERGEDRLFPEQEIIELPEPIYVEYDTNGNGIVDLVTEDVDRNGIPESYYLDLNEDENTDIILWDGNENGYAEWRGSTQSISGVEVFVWEIDIDEDDTIDQIGIDVDLDGEIDRFEPA